jgi:hypothetical protein
MSAKAVVYTAPPEADPAHEIFDLVDDSGAIIGQEARAVVHKLGLLHRAGGLPCNACAGASRHRDFLLTPSAC